MEKSQNDQFTCALGAVKIKDGLFVGDEYASNDLEFAITNKITHVINSASSELQNNWEGVGVKYQNFDWKESDDQVLFDEQNQIPQMIFNFIEESVQQGTSCLVLSVKGQSRACCVLVAYFFLKFRWSLYKILEFLNSRRPDLEIRASFFHQLQQFEHRMSNNFNQPPLSSDWNQQSNERDCQELILRNTFLNSKQNDSNIEEKFMNYQKNGTLKNHKCKKVIWIDEIGLHNDVCTLKEFYEYEYLAQNLQAQNSSNQQLIETLQNQIQLQQQISNSNEPKIKNGEIGNNKNLNYFQQFNNRNNVPNNFNPQKNNSQNMEQVLNAQKELLNKRTTEFNSLLSPSYETNNNSTSYQGFLQKNSSNKKVEDEKKKNNEQFSQTFYQQQPIQISNKRNITSAQQNNQKPPLSQQLSQQQQQIKKQINNKNQQSMVSSLKAAPSTHLHKFRADSPIYGFRSPTSNTKQPIKFQLKDKQQNQSNDKQTQQQQTYDLQKLKQENQQVQKCYEKNNIKNNSEIIKHQLKYKKSNQHRPSSVIPHNIQNQTSRAITSLTQIEKQNKQLLYHSYRKDNNSKSQQQQHQNVNNNIQNLKIYQSMDFNNNDNTIIRQQDNKQQLSMQRKEQQLILAQNISLIQKRNICNNGFIQTNAPFQSKDKQIVISSKERQRPQSANCFLNQNEKSSSSTYQKSKFENDQQYLPLQLVNQNIQIRQSYEKMINNAKSSKISQNGQKPQNQNLQNFQSQLLNIQQRINQQQKQAQYQIENQRSPQQIPEKTKKQVEQYQNLQSPSNLKFGLKENIRKVWKY